MSYLSDVFFVDVHIISVYVHIISIEFHFLFHKVFTLSL